ncbi:four helix bundle protein [Luteolibacter sp. SL250]|uniref:four helix bundle protein n=1 Tax=Luteolibacter sp. SL250 TaxID=2995170 RepID=UPI00226DBB88|nr:four helix bundle protein [Luteolibacter sp. SL250]WAC20619.1 four helix bundle protein [Luteolibacter sp. SL250]
MAITTFEDLEVWKRGCQLAVDVCVRTHDSKNYNLKDQMQRAAISIPSNIAEGAERDSEGDFVRFLRISKGSCGELRTQLYISECVQKALGQPPTENSREMIKETREISAMLQGLIRSITSRRQQDSR